MPDRKYDVAFSFLTADLPLAQGLEDALTPLCNFVFARQHEKIAMSDGMDIQRLDTESGLNVVPYREMTR